MVTPETIKLQGGSLALDFANTVDWDEDDNPIAGTDVLVAPDSLARWGRRLGVAGALTGPVDAGELTVARELRDALHALFAALAGGHPPSARDLACVQASYASAVSAGRLARRDAATGEPAAAASRRTAAGRSSSGPGAAASHGPDGQGPPAPAAFHFDWPADDERRVRFAVAVDAVSILTDPACVARLHRCPGRNCGWVFLDRSGRRRWCSMATCGSREKMRRLYARKRATGREAPADDATA